MSKPASTAVVPPLSPSVALVLAALLLLALFMLSLPNDFLWQRVLEDSGHGPVFAGFAVAVLWMIAPRPEQPVRAVGQYVGVFAVAVAVGVATELLQGFLPDRNVSARDALHDAAGAALGLAVFWLIERHLARKRRVPCGAAHLAWVVAIALAGFVLLAWAPLQCARAYALRAQAWPDLLPLGEPAGSAFIRSEPLQLSRAPLPDEYARPGDGLSTRLEYGVGSRPVVNLFEPVADWRGKGALVIDLTNPSAQPLELTLRILDRRHDWSHADRFNQPLLIAPATRMTVRISLAAVAAAPSGRRMDMSAIADVMLFATRPLNAGELYVTRIALE